MKKYITYWDFIRLTVTDTSLPKLKFSLENLGSKYLSVTFSQTALRLHFQENVCHF